MNPKQAIEKAAKHYHDSCGLSIPTFKGIENTVAIDNEPDSVPEPRIVPCGTVAVEGDLTEAIPFTGDWEGDLTVSVEADGQNTKDADFDTLCDSVFKNWNWSDLKERITAAARAAGQTAFTCLFANVQGLSGKFTDGNNWVNSLRVHVIFCEVQL